MGGWTPEPPSDTELHSVLALWPKNSNHCFTNNPFPFFALSLTRISLNVMTLMPRCEHVETQRGVALTVTAVAQVMIMADDALSGEVLWVVMWR